MAIGGRQAQFRGIRVCHPRVRVLGLNAGGGGGGDDHEPAPRTLGSLHMDESIKKGPPDNDL